MKTIRLSLLFLIFGICTSCILDSECDDAVMKEIVLSIDVENRQDLTQFIEWPSTGIREYEYFLQNVCKGSITTIELTAETAVYDMPKSQIILIQLLYSHNDRPKILPVRKSSYKQNTFYACAEGIIYAGGNDHITLNILPHSASEDLNALKKLNLKITTWTNY